MTEQGGDPGNSWRQLAEDIVDDLTEDTPYGRMIERRRLFESIPRLRPRFSMEQFIFPAGDEDISRLVLDEFQGDLATDDVPQSIDDLRRILSDVVPQRLFLTVEQPFPPSIVADVRQEDIDLLYSVVCASGFALPFASSDPICFAWIALQYFAANTPQQRS